MIKRLLVGVVGVAMGGLVGLVVSAFFAGGLAIIGGAVIGGLVFFFGVPALLERQEGPRTAGRGPEAGGRGPGIG